MALRIANVTENEVREFLKNLTQNEMKYYDIYNDHVLETYWHINGVWDDDKLVGIGGLAKWYKVLPRSFYMIKEPYQGQGIGRTLAEMNMEYAPQKVPFLVSCSILNNTKSVNLILGRGYQKVYSGYGRLYGIKIFKNYVYPLKWMLMVAIPIYARIKNRNKRE